MYSLWELKTDKKHEDYVVKRKKLVVEMFQSRGNSSFLMNDEELWCFLKLYWVY